MHRLPEVCKAHFHETDVHGLSCMERQDIYVILYMVAYKNGNLVGYWEGLLKMFLGELILGLIQAILTRLLVRNYSLAPRLKRGPYITPSDCDSSGYSNRIRSEVGSSSIFWTSYLRSCSEVAPKGLGELNFKGWIKAGSNNNVIALYT